MNRSSLSPCFPCDLESLGIINGHSYIPVATSNSGKVIYLFKQSKASLIKYIDITPKPENVLRSPHVQLHTTYITGTAENTHTCVCSETKLSFPAARILPPNKNYFYCMYMQSIVI